LLFRKDDFEPLVVETCWPTKKARIGGVRKKRTEQIVLSCDKRVQNQPPDSLLDVPAAGLDAIMDVQEEEHLDVQEEEHLDVPAAQDEVVLEVHMQIESNLELQTEPVQMQIESNLDSIPAQGGVMIGGPSESEDPKKTRSLAVLLGGDPTITSEETACKSKKKSGKRKKSSAKRK
jgi:hypothetical protein